jgi:integrase
MGWVEAFLESCKRRGLSENTIICYRYRLRDIINHQALNLESCSEAELFSSLDGFREKHSLAYYGLQVAVMKRALKFLGRKELAEKIEHPRRPDRAATIKVLPQEDVERLIREAPNLQDRLVVELLDELGGRRSEVARLRIRDAQFDEYGAILWLNGKTGTRRRRIYASVPDLREQINNHPQKNDPDAALFLNSQGKPFSTDTLYDHVKKLGRRILGKEICPKMFRHTRATHDASYFTDSEMMLLFGWKTADMVRVYAHLSMRDVEEKDLVLHGLKPREEILRPLVHVQRCPSCGEENAPIAIYCVKCGGILPNEQLAGLDRILAEPDFMKRLVNSESFKDALRKALGE